MAPVPVYSASPINASKAAGVSPHTQRADEDPRDARDMDTQAGRRPPRAHPGAGPSLPVETGTPGRQYQPTPTATTSSGAPRPGAVPVPLAAEAESARLGQAAAQTTAVPMPPQMSYRPPVASLPIQGRSSTSTMAMTAGQSHPPGYQQNVNASGLNSYDGAQDSRSAMAWPDHDGGQPGVWDTARKWAQAAGESLAAAEHQVWKRVNQDKD